MRLGGQSIGQIDGSKGRVIACAPMRRVAAPLCFALAACAGAPRALTPTPTPATVLRITVVYPKTTDVVQSRDSAFLFGSAGRGDAVLTVNGTPVAVHPNGAWIAWLPLPDDTIAPFRIVATAAGDSQVVEFKARVAPRFHPPQGRAAWVDTLSFAPAGTLALPPGEGMRLAVRAAPGATVRLRTPSGTVVPLVRDPLPGEPAWGERAFGTEPAGLRVPASPDRYVGWLPAQWLCADSAGAAARGCALLEVVAAGDTVRAVWPLRVTLLDPARPVVVALDDDTSRTTSSLGCWSMSSDSMAGICCSRSVGPRHSMPRIRCAGARSFSTRAIRPPARRDRQACASRRSRSRWRSRPRHCSSRRAPRSCSPAPTRCRWTCIHGPGSPSSTAPTCSSRSMRMRSPMA